MCAVIFPFFRRLFSSFVLTCFLWTTLFQAIAFGNYEPVSYETRGQQVFAHFNIGIHSLSRNSPRTVVDVDLLTESYPSSKMTQLVVPLGKTLDETQDLIDELYKESIYEDLTITENGLTWTSYGIDFFMHTSGSLDVSGSATSSAAAEHLQLYNPHGSIVLKDDLHFEHLSLNTEEVISTGNLSVNALSLQGNMTYTNKGFLSVSTLLFDNEFIDPASRDTLSQFINKGRIVGDGGMNIKGNGSFVNEATGLFEAPEGVSLLNTSFVNHGVVKAGETTTLALTKALFNDGAMIFERDVHVSGKFVLENKAKTEVIPSFEAVPVPSGISIKQDIFFDNFKGSLDNENVFSAETMQGSFYRLSNHGVFGVNGVFDNLTVDRAINHSTGQILGDGRITIGKGENAGLFRSSHLDLGLVDSFDNTGHIEIADLKTHGAGIFRQRGHVKSTKAVINNAHFENEHHLSQTELDLSFGEDVTSFRNGAEIVLETKSLTFAHSAAETTALNEGFIEVIERFDNARFRFVNKKQVQAKTWHQRGTAFTNASKAVVHVTGATDIDLDLIDNDGSILLDGEVSGRIGQLTNKGGLVLKEQTTLTGKRLDNTGTFLAHNIFDWTGNILENRGHMFFADNRVKTTQIINHKILRWTHNLFITSHLLNLGLLHRTDTVDSDHPDFKVALNKRTPFKRGTIENRGTISSITPFAKRASKTTVLRHYDHWDNSGVMALHRLHLGAQTFKNAGHVTTERGITGRVDTFENAGTLLSRGRVEIQGQTLFNSGKFVSEKGITYNGRSLKCTGDLSSKGAITGAIETIDNTGKIISNDEIRLSGKTLSNSGSITATKKASYNGEMFTSTNAAVFQGDILDLTTTNPLALKGIVKANQGATVSAPSLENGAQFTVIKGKTTINGTLLNHGKMDVDELVYEGKTITNAKKGFLSAKPVIEANSYQRLTPLDLLSNEGTVIIRRGGFTAQAVKNKGKLTLLDGLYQFDGWDNHGGDATLDQLRITCLSPSFSGTLNVARFVRPLRDYVHMFIFGKTIIHAGGFRTQYLHNYNLGKEGALSLGNGHYAIVEFKNKKDAKLVLQRGAHVAVGDIDNEGEMISPVNLTLDSLMSRSPTPLSSPVYAPPVSQALTVIDPSVTSGAKTILEHSAKRSSAFNALLDVPAERLSAEKEEIYQPTRAIVRILSSTNIDQKRVATTAEKKIVLQAIMDAEISAYIHTEEQQAELFLTPKLPALETTNPNFKHFEILRLTEKVSRAVVAHTTEHGYESLDLAFKLYATDIKTLCGHSGLKEGTFFRWFKESFEKNKIGFVNSTTSSLSILPNASKQVFGITKLGVVSTEKNLGIKSTHLSAFVNWIDKFLFENKQNFRIGSGHLFIETDRFVNRYNFTRPADVLPEDHLP